MAETSSGVMRLSFTDLFKLFSKELQRLPPPYSRRRLFFRQSTGLGRLSNPLIDRRTIASTEYVNSYFFEEESTVLSSTSHWERLYLPSSLWERSLLSSYLLVVRNIPASSLSMRGETSPVFKPVLCSSLLERVVKSSAFMALALAFRAFTDHSMVLGLKKAVFNSALLQISSYRSLEDWISLVEDVAAACVLSTASDIGFRSHNVFSDSLNLATLIISKELVHRCVIPLIL
ncbi:hypothetical protein F2Q68_00042931 [Brassica cretica]|uniref:Uncharacterized protein n=2 Tax=Brassica cretica TaxID=69181 RepID=A0A8S9LM85_BRACR|nr:hypothetical protein F2Q68_00042931 [Brassica cretica]KAF3518255.1 hypothetical protein DY000_02058424 [Brassica cretica]